jgi:hypothetical protein
MRRASVIVLLLTFLALIAGTLAVPARSAGLVWTITPTVIQSPASSGTNAVAGEDVTPSPNFAVETAQAQTAVAFSQVQSTIALGVGRPDLHWQPLWDLLQRDSEEPPFIDPPEDLVIRTSGVPQVVLGSSLLQDWTVDNQAWAIQLALILAFGGLLFLALRILGARREANRDHAPVAAR